MKYQMLHNNNVDVSGKRPLKLAHSLLGYAVGMTDINRPGSPITRKHTHRNKFEQNLSPQEATKKYIIIFNKLTRFKIKLQNEIHFTGNSQKQKLSFTISAKLNRGYKKKVIWPNFTNTNLEWF